MITLDPPDACPAAGCFPGDSPACLPLSAETVPGGILASYECPCGLAWETLYDEHGWPVERTTADVAEALAEQDRERKNAA